MTETELKSLLIRLCPDLEGALYHVPGYLPRALTDAAAYCFMEQVPDSSDTRELRRQLAHLRKTGCLDLV